MPCSFVGDVGARNPTADHGTAHRCGQRDIPRRHSGRHLSSCRLLRVLGGLEAGHVTRPLFRVVLAADTAELEVYAGLVER